MTHAEITTLNDWRMADVLVLRETEKALWVELEDDRAVWIPKSVTRWATRVENTGRLFIKKWFVAKERLWEGVMACSKANLEHLA
jgi:hypothetical protein